MPMFGEKTTKESDNAQQVDTRLTTLLKQWEPPQPSPNFEAAVWRRIDASQSQSTMFQWRILRPAWSAPIAAAAGLMIGIGLALALPTQQRPARHIAGPLFHSQTVAGSYLAMTTGGTR
jgi:hypothetical protein